MKTITIDSVELVLANPVDVQTQWIGQAEPLRQLLACWLSLNNDDLPLTPRIIGVPGIGKTTLAMTAAKLRKQPLYIQQCTADTRPEDLLVTPVLSEGKKIAYHASPLLSAVITGGVAVLDEGNRMSEKSWASLAGLLDNRRMVESVVAGIAVTAHRDFRTVVTMNEDASTFEIPDYIMSRLQPGIALGFPDRTDEQKILSYAVPFCPEEVLDLCVNYLQQAHGFDLPYSIRDGVNAIRYTLKMQNSSPDTPTPDLFCQSIRQILGAEALDLATLGAQRARAGTNLPDMNLGDFFFPDDDGLNPDSRR